MLLQIQKVKKKSWLQGIKHNILKMFQISPRVISNKSCKFHNIPFIHFYVMLLTVMAPLLVWGPWNNLVGSETVWSKNLLYFGQHILKNPQKSFYPSFRNVASKHGSRKLKSPSWIQGVKHNIAKMCWIVPCWIFDISRKSHGNLFTQFSVISVTDTDYPKKNSVCKRLNGTSPKCFTYHIRSILKNFMKIHSAVFP